MSNQNKQTNEGLLERILEEEEELRRISPSDGAHGKNASDYHNMYDLFLQVAEHAKSLKLDPKAFTTRSGDYNDKMINAYAKLVSLAIKGLSELNRMRNQDRMTAHILDKHTRDLVQSVTIDLAIELKSVLDAVEDGQPLTDVSTLIRKLMYRRLPEIFLRSASNTLSSSKEEFGLVH